jgi:hypothetical protein
MRHFSKFLTSFFILLSGCERYNLQDYQDAKPKVSIKEFFNGPLQAWGIFQDYTGKVIKHFTVKMEGHWVGNKGELSEDFEWSDGTKTQRVWKLEALSENHVISTADDVIGQGEGISVGNAIQWVYRVKIPVNGSEYQFDFDDWMFALDDKIIINKAKMKKFGFTVGEVTLFMKKGS